jgi:hypothetical protein
VALAVDDDICSTGKLSETAGNEELGFDMEVLAAL